MSSPINVAIVGITGITGEELVRIFEVYPEVNLVAATARQDERTLGQLYPQYGRFKNIKISPFDLQNFIDLKVQIVFVALPHGEAMQMVPDLLKNNMRVIDLGADFRLRDRAIFEKWYVPHTAWDEMSHAVYGMVEFNRSQIRNAKLVANPGCYVTAATFALLPLLQAQIISKAGIIIDAKSGVSGGGRKLVAEKATWNDSFKAYGVTGHRHLPEIEQNLQASAVFIPHLLPLDRGIVATCYAKLENGKTLAQAQAVFQKLADENIFVEYVTSPPELKNIIGTNKIQIYGCVDANAGHLIVISALDNLVKGAAGQAVQNMNLLLGWPEQQGLSNLQVLTDNHSL